ncbi:hypothetical protein [Ferruginibacter profundus]
MTEYEGQIKELSKLIKSWNLIDVSSYKEFDKFSQKLLDRLYEGHSSLKIKGIIESELCITYGFFSWDFDSDFLTKQILLWWDK